VRKAHSVDTVRIAVVAHIPRARLALCRHDVHDHSVHRAVAAVMLGLNMAGVPWTDASGASNTQASRSNRLADPVAIDRSSPIT
jgi:hypothetical protein